LKFRVGEFTLRYTSDFIRFDTAWGRLCPTTCYVKNICNYINQEEFLQLPVLLVSDQFVTVEDVIKYEANVRGGVHFGTIHKSNWEAHSASSISIGGVRITFQLLPSIARISLEALFPLYKFIAKRYDISIISKE
jgi:hypothetical protein